MPRPTKYSAQTADRILSALKAGNTRTASALYAGIDYSTLCRWAERYAEFRDALTRAEAEAEVRYAATLAKAAQDGDWRAALEWLKRRRHEDWRERTETQLTGKDGEPLGDTLSDEARAARILAIVQRARERATESADAAEPNLGAANGSTDGSMAL